MSSRSLYVYFIVRPEANSSFEATRRAEISVASTRAGSTTPASTASRHLPAHKHHASPGRSPGNDPRGVSKSFPRERVYFKNSGVTSAHTVWAPISLGPVLQ